MSEHHWLSVAEEQLLVAIEIYKSGKSYISALTLAGAAEEILGTELKNNMNTFNSKDILVRHLFSLLTDEEKNHVGGEKGVGSSVNEYRNFLKHRKDYEVSYFDAKAEAWEILQRAIANFLSLRPLHQGPIFEFKFEKDPRHT